MTIGGESLCGEGVGGTGSGGRGGSVSGSCGWATAMIVASAAVSSSKVKYVVGLYLNPPDHAVVLRATRPQDE